MRSRRFRQIDRIDEYLSAAQVGITMASIGLGFLGEPALARLLEPVFGGVMSHGVAVAISVAIAYAIVTSAHVIVGEQAPKMMAITRAERRAALDGTALRVVQGRLPPVIWALNGASNFVVTRILGIKIEGDLEALSSDELRQLVEPAASRRRARPGRGATCCTASSTCTSRRPAR